MYQGECIQLTLLPTESFDLQSTSPAAVAGAAASEAECARRDNEHLEKRQSAFFINLMIAPEEGLAKSGQRPLI